MSAPRRWSRRAGAAVAALAAVMTVAEASASEVREGTVMRCTAPGALPVVARVRRIERSPAPGRGSVAETVVHVELWVRGGRMPYVAHAPFAPAALRGCRAAREAPPPGPLFESGYALWLTDARRGRAGAYAINPAEAYAESIETSRRAREGAPQ